MPRRLRMQGLQAELASVGALLEGARVSNDPVGEYQLEIKKEKIESEIKSMLSTPEYLASVALLFGGEPVYGSRGISADFAGKMLENFQDLVARKFASAELGVLAGTGPIPMKPNTRLMVTNLAKGSFGFVLNEISDQTELNDTALKSVVEETVQTLEHVSSTNELDFEEAIEELDARLLIALKNFFVALDSSKGTVRLVDDVADVSLDSLAVQRGRLRIEATSIDEQDTTLSGTLIGFLPEHKKFEMQVDGQTLYGSVSREAAEQYARLVAEGANPERQGWLVRMKRRTVTPLNRPSREVNRLLEFVRPVSHVQA